MYRNTSAAGESVQWVVTSYRSDREATHTRKGGGGGEEGERIMNEKRERIKINK